MRDHARIVAEQTGLSVEQARIALRAWLQEIVDGLISHGRVQFDRFGIFELKVRKGRKGRNPRTGERVIIPDKVCVFFRPSKALAQFIDGPSSRGKTRGGAVG